MWDQERCGSVLMWTHALSPSPGSGAVVQVSGLQEAAGVLGGIFCYKKALFHLWFHPRTHSSNWNIFLIPGYLYISLHFPAFFLMVISGSSCSGFQVLGQGVQL